MSDHSDASRLLVYGMDHRRLPTEDTDYAAQITRWTTDPGFKALVCDIGIGLGIEVCEVSAAGIFLSPTGDSLFRWDRREYDRRVPAESSRRLLHGLAQIGIAARCFPTEYDLADSTRREVSVAPVERLITGECERLRAEHGEADVRADQPGLEQAWRLWLQQPVGGTVRDTMRSRKGIIGRALKILDEDLGLLRRVSGRPGVYRTSERYRFQVREIAGQHAFSLLTAAATRTA